jgi:hypothetical protein
LKINDNNLKIQYQNAATRLVTQKYKWNYILLLIKKNIIYLNY